MIISVPELSFQISFEDFLRLAQSGGRFPHKDLGGLTPEDVDSVGASLVSKLEAVGLGDVVRRIPGIDAASTSCILSLEGAEEGSG